MKNIIIPETYKHIFLTEEGIETHEISDVLHSDHFQLVSINSPYLSKKQRRSQSTYINRIQYTMQDLLGLCIDSGSEPIVDMKIRGACFLRVQNFPLYLSGDISVPQKEFEQKKPIERVLIKEHLIVSCLFGSNMRGVLNSGGETACINHSIHPSTRFLSLVVDDSDHPYEVTMWESVKAICLHLNPHKIKYHLPLEDYLLFGLHLLHHKIIDMKLYDFYAEKVQKRAKKHMKKIHEINSDIEITSPFAGLHITPKAGLERYLKDVLSMKHGKIWEQIIQEVGIPTTIDAFLKLGNLVFIAQSSLRYNPFEVCTLYPSSERPIINQYSKYLDAIFPSISSLVWLPPVSGFRNMTLFETPGLHNVEGAFRYYWCK